MRRLFGWIGLVLLVMGLGSCRAHRAQHAETDAQLAALTARVAALESAQGRPGGGATASPLDEERARVYLKRATEAAERAEFDEAKLALNELMGLYPTTRTATQALRMSQELAIIGQPVGAPPGILQWFSGGPDDLHLDQGLTLIVFFEQWCPHCQRELPKLQGLTEVAGQPVEVLALTRITKTSTVQNTAEFLLQHGITYAVAQEDGVFYERAQVYGIPAAMVVKDGVVLWRGHPALLDEALWLALLKP
ncbi:MAG: TlpA family protein disulfide reductase [Deltaproteobacteria bacterium]|nr:TlpA family protein disulfide reductase [Deltaproteobacteria bacterium]